MGALAGLYNLNGQPAGPGAELMLRRLSHRGRTSRVWSDGAIALAERGPLGSDARVARHDASGVVVVADARIDGGSGGLPPTAASDAARVILDAWLRRGPACADELLGDYAFAVWDPGERTIFLARDPMGVKPVYYYRDGQQFAFATELRALHALPFVDASLDEEQVGLFLLWEHDDRRKTLFRSIRRLPGGHTLRVSPDRFEEREYWRPGSDREIRLGSAEAYAEAFRETFFEAVRARTGETSPVAAALSGGVDSSSIACVARELHRAGAGPAVETFSLVFPGLGEDDLKRIDERAYVDAVVGSGGLQAHRLRGDELSPLGALDEVLASLGEPHFAPNLYLHWGMFRAAAARGAEVFLDGFDGDSAVSHGTGRLGSMASRGDWALFEAETRAFAGRRGVTPEAVLPHYGLPQLAAFAAGGRWLLWAGAFRELRRRFRTSRLELVREYGLRPILGRLRGGRGPVEEPGIEYLEPGLARRMADRIRSRPPISALDVEMERTAHVGVLSQPAYQLTLELADQSAAAFQLSPRYPFFDRRLIALCLSIPAEHKFAEGWTRLTMRRGLKGVVPDEVLWRMSKSNLSPNFHRGLRADREIIAETDLEVLGPYTNVGQLEAMRTRFLMDDRRVDPDAMLLFRTTVLARWLAQRSGRRATEGHRESAAGAAA